MNEYIIPCVKCAVVPLTLSRSVHKRIYIHYIHLRQNERIQIPPQRQPLVHQRGRRHDQMKTYEAADVNLLDSVLLLSYHPRVIQCREYYCRHCHHFAFHHLEGTGVYEQILAHYPEVLESMYAFFKNSKVKKRL